jgi:acetyltransferase-like isoleucine patch superfamily enzyme
MRKLLIVGAGGFAREVQGYIEDDNPLFLFKGFLDDRSNLLEKTPRSPGIIGSPDTYIPESDEVFMAAIGDPRARERYTRHLRELGVDFATVIHPLAHVSRRAAIGTGCIIAPRVGISVLHMHSRIFNNWS